MNAYNKPTIYLAGPFAGLTFAQATEWRDKATFLLSPQWRVINPCKSEQSKVTDKNDIVVYPTRRDKNLDLSLTSSGICSKDEFYINNSDWLFCNFLGAKHLSAGTLYEIGYARGKDKKILSVIEPGSVHDIAWVRRRSDIFTDSFDEAIDFFQTIAI